MEENIKFSILLPTKDRLDLLKYAVNSVRKQSYSNWEIVVSDNCSKQDVKKWIDSLQDARIICQRQKEALSVTENWNAANNISSGDYKIMLGDDDALLPDALEILYQKICQYGAPEVVVSPAYIYLQPNVDPVVSSGDLLRAFPIVEIQKEQMIEAEQRKELVKQCCSFERTFGYNMQFYCYSKQMEEKVKKYGAFFEPPYPDYYTASLMLFIADTVLMIDEITTIIGVTSKSYGFYYRNNIEKEGMSFHKEADYRNHAPKKIRELLCSVDEMSTAAAATFALLAERIDELEISIINYYKRVIDSQSMYVSMQLMQNLANEEMYPHISEPQRDELDQYIVARYRYTVENRVDGSNQFRYKKSIPYKNISELLENIDQIKRIMEETEGHYDIYEWEKLITDSKQMQQLDSKKRYIWGAYSRGSIFEKLLKKMDLSVAGYIDKDIQRKTYAGLPVVQPKDILPQENIAVIISQKNLYIEILELLNQYEYKTEDGYVYIKNRVN